MNNLIESLKIIHLIFLVETIKIDLSRIIYSDLLSSSIIFQGIKIRQPQRITCVYSFDGKLGFYSHLPDLANDNKTSDFFNEQKIFPLIFIQTSVNTHDQWPLVTANLRVKNSLK